MNLSISLLGFSDKKNFEDQIQHLQLNNINFVEGVYSKLNEFLPICKKYNFQIKSTQSLLYGSNIKDFTENGFIDHLKSTIKFYKTFGIETLVLGSPKQRNIWNEAKLLSIFSQLNLICQQENVILCIEPNCKQYGGSYFYNLSQIVNFIDKGKFSNIKTMIDTHNLLNENLSPSKEFEMYHNYVSHIHISENNLNPIKYNDEYVLLSQKLKDLNYNGIVNYEVFPHQNLNIKLFSNLFL
jgi:sugar phosphate isomerase/epimerase